MKSIAALLLTLVSTVHAQTLQIPEGSAANEPTLSVAIRTLARELLDERDPLSPAERFQLQLATDQYEKALASLESVRAGAPRLAAGTLDRSIPLELYARAKALELRGRLPFSDAFSEVFAETFERLDDRAALEAGWLLGTPLFVFEDRLRRSVAAQESQRTLSGAEAIEIVSAFNTRNAFGSIAPLVSAAVSADDSKRYSIDENVLIKTDEGVTLSAVVVRKKGAADRQPATLWFNIYVNLASSLYEAKLAAIHGYVGVAADPRGKRLSPDRIRPWETEAGDTYAVIDWISKQSWSDGQVGMYGSSHGAFSAWAATKRLHPALKTIVAASASQPGFGLPMQNNVFQFAQYAFPFYVMNNKTTDDATYFDHGRWRALQDKWFSSGRSFREIDALDGTPNPLLQTQLQHPSFDAYYQAMQPYREDYANIDIPVLSLTGYFDDANAAAVEYLREHYKYNNRPKHYLVIGPYDHGATARSFKSPIVKGYEIDPSAQLDSVALTYQWFDHVMRNGPRPALLRDRINYQVMGADIWRHARSIEAMSERILTLYLTDSRVGDRYLLTDARSSNIRFLEQEVDFADRTSEINLYPVRAIEDKVDLSNGFAFVSEPFVAPVSFEGQLRGQLKATINKKDMDFTLALYELMPNGKLFNLSYYLGRASYAVDMSKRKLLEPGKTEIIPFERTPLMSRQMQKGSRLLLLLTVNKNRHAQINYGTGKDVSDESIKDALEPLRVRWHTDSFVNVPIRGPVVQSNPSGNATRLAPRAR